MTDVLDPLAQLAALVVDPSGTRWGDLASGQQWADARSVLGMDGPRWTWLTRPRGGSKTTDAGGLALAWLMTQALHAERGYVLAADLDQAALVMQAVERFVARTPDLRGWLKVERWRVTHVLSDASVEVMASDGPSAWGTGGQLYILDELSSWPDTANARMVWDAVYTSLPKTVGARLVVLTMAGSPGHWSFEIRKEALSSGSWRVSEMPGPVPWVDQVALEVQRKTMPAWKFARWHLGQWVEADDVLALRADVEAAAKLDGPQPYKPRFAYLISLDLGIVKDRAVAVVAHAEWPEAEWVADPKERLGGRMRPSVPRIVVDRMQVWAGSKADPVRLDEVEDWIAQAAAEYNAAVVADPWQTEGLIQRLGYRDVAASTFTFSSSSIGRIASTLHELLRGRRIDLPKWPALIDELANVKLRETTPGVVRMDHERGRHDDMAVAIGLAAVVLLDIAPPKRPVMMVARARDSRSGWDPNVISAEESLCRKLADLGDRSALAMVRDYESRRKPQPMDVFLRQRMSMR